VVVPWGVLYSVSCGLSTDIVPCDSLDILRGSFPVCPGSFWVVSGWYLFFLVSGDVLPIISLTLKLVVFFFGFFPYFFFGSRDIPHLVWHILLTAHEAPTSPSNPFCSPNPSCLSLVK